MISDETLERLMYDTCLTSDDDGELIHEMARELIAARALAERVQEFLYVDDVDLEGALAQLRAIQRGER